MNYTTGSPQCMCTCPKRWRHHTIATALEHVPATSVAAESYHRLPTVHVYTMRVMVKITHNGVSDVHVYILKVRAEIIMVSPLRCTCVHFDGTTSHHRGSTIHDVRSPGDGGIISSHRHCACVHCESEGKITCPAVHVYIPE